MAALVVGPRLPPTRALLFALQRQNKPTAANAVFALASAGCEGGTFRSRTHFKNCLRELRRQKLAWVTQTEQPARTGGARVMAVSAHDGAGAARAKMWGALAARERAALRMARAADG